MLLFVLNSKAFDIDFLSSSSIIIRRLSFPLKNIKGIWQARTTKKIYLNTVDSQGQLESLMHSFPRFFRIVAVSSLPILLPKVYKLITAKVTYRIVTNKDAIPKFFVH